MSGTVLEITSDLSEWAVRVAADESARLGQFARERAERERKERDEDRIRLTNRLNDILATWEAPIVATDPCLRIAGCELRPASDRNGCYLKIYGRPSVSAECDEMVEALTQIRTRAQLAAWLTEPKAEFLPLDEGEPDWANIGPAITARAVPEPPAETRPDYPELYRVSAFCGPAEAAAWLNEQAASGYMLHTLSGNSEGWVWIVARKSEGQR
jgi:hypothetical protein